jgi:hypothetical protein
MKAEPTKLGEAASDAEIEKALAESDLFGRKLEAALDKIIHGAAHGAPIESGEAASDAEIDKAIDVSDPFGRELLGHFARRLASEMNKMTDEDSAESGQRE